MDNSLFDKYKKVVKERDEDKEKIIKIIKKETSIDLNEKEININNKKITFNISSIKKSLLFKNKIKEILEKEGYKFNL